MIGHLQGRAAAHKRELDPRVPHHHRAGKARIVRVELSAIRRVRLLVTPQYPVGSRLDPPPRFWEILRRVVPETEFPIFQGITRNLPNFPCFWHVFRFSVVGGGVRTKNMQISRSNLSWAPSRGGSCRCRAQGRIGS